MLTIFYLTQDWSEDFRDTNGHPTLGGSGHTRIGLPAKYLARNGHDVQIGRIIIDPDTNEIGCQTWDGVNHFGADIVVLQHLMHKDLPETIRHSRVNGTVVLVDVDDDYWSLSPANRAWWITHPRKSDDVNINHFYKVIAEADGITVSTPALKKRLERAGKKVYLVRNAIDLEDWRPNKRRRKEPVIGWVGSTQTRSGDIEILMGILEQFCEKHSLQVFHGGDLQGANSFSSLANVDDKRMLTAPMTSVQDYPSLFTHFDIGVIPLSKAPFNDSKCVDGSTRVVTRDGQKPIREVVEGDEVWSGTGWRTVEATHIESPRQGLQIETDRGYCIRVSPEHKMWTSTGWVQAQDFKIGDRLWLGCSTAPERECRVKWPLLLTVDPREPRDFTNADSMPEIKVDETWGEFLGFFISDGSIGGKTRVNISWDGQDHDIGIHLEHLAHQMGLAAHSERKKMRDGTPLKRRMQTGIHSSALVKILQSMGVVVGRAKRECRVPSVIWKSPKPVVASFLRAYFEGDGNKCSTGCEVSSKDLELLEEIQRLLLVFGITSRLEPSSFRSSDPIFKKYNGRIYWTLRLSRAGADVFEKEIGFVSERKKAALRSVCEKPHSNKYTPISFEEEVRFIQPCMIEPVDIQVSGDHKVLADGFVVSNSCLRGLEYTAAGIPWVASDSPDYHWLRTEHGVGFLASRPHDWLYHLKNLLSLSYREAVLDAWQVSLKHFDIADRWEDWRGAYWAALMSS